MQSDNAFQDRTNASLEALKLFRIIFKSTSQHFQQVEKVTGIGGASLWALSEIAKSEFMTVNALAKSMSIHQSTASNLLEKLETSGYLNKLRSNIDKRVVNITLTDKGHKLLSKAPSPHTGVLSDALLKLDPETLEELNNNLQKILTLLHTKHLEDGYRPLGKF